MKYIKSEKHLKIGDVIFSVSVNTQTPEIISVKKESVVKVIEGAKVFFMRNFRLKKPTVANCLNDYAYDQNTCKSKNDTIVYVLSNGDYIARDENGFISSDVKHRTLDLKMNCFFSKSIHCDSKRKKLFVFKFTNDPQKDIYFIDKRLLKIGLKSIVKTFKTIIKTKINTEYQEMQYIKDSICSYMKLMKNVSEFAEIPPDELFKNSYFLSEKSSPE